MKNFQDLSKIDLPMRIILREYDYVYLICHLICTELKIMSLVKLDITVRWKDGGKQR